MRTRKEVWTIVLRYYFAYIKKLNIKSKDDARQWSISICKVLLNCEKEGKITGLEFDRADEEILNYASKRRIQYSDCGEIVFTEGNYLWKPNDTQSRIKWMTTRAKR